MNPPPFLLAATLLFWGWQTGMVLAAVIMAVLLETPRGVSWRWDFSAADFRRIWDLCTLLFLGAGAYCFLSRDTTNDLMELFKAATFTRRNQSLNQAISAGFIFFQWWPLIFFPFAVAQAYSVRDRIPLATFWWHWRRRADRGPAISGAEIQITYPYFAICLAATSVTNLRTPLFYSGLCLLTAWALWPARPRRFPTVVWLGLFLLVVTLGYGGHTGLHLLQGVLENKAAGWVSGFNRKNQDGLESITAIGRIGKVKLSGKIVLRVEPEGKPPALLREASFNTFRSPNWMLARKEFVSVAPEADLTTWKLRAAARASDAVHISGYVRNGTGILAVPNGTAQIENLPVGEVKSNYFGALRTFVSPGFVRFRAQYGAGESFDSPPDGTADLKIPVEEQAAVAKVAADLNLHSEAPLTTKLKIIETFFENNFQYSTWLKKKAASDPKATTAVSDFLLRNRSGHCEYFATATVLLLREAGIPARYANGYSVQEQEKAGGRYIIRERHAHAWCLYYDSADQAWHDFDTTPASWVAVEDRTASMWEPLGDAWSRLWYEFTKWRWLGTTGQLQKYLAALLALLILVLVWRLFFKQKRKRRSNQKGSSESAPDGPGADSEFYLVATRLNELGLTRETGETVSSWLHRLEAMPSISVAPLRTLLSLHYRYRFDPHGLVAVDRAALTSCAQQWLAESHRAIDKRQH